jgi:hypothetical protein
VVLQFGEDGRAVRIEPFAEGESTPFG